MLRLTFTQRMMNEKKKEINTTSKPTAEVIEGGSDTKIEKPEAVSTVICTLMRYEKREDLYCMLDGFVLIYVAWQGNS